MMLRIYVQVLHDLRVQYYLFGILQGRITYNRDTYYKKRK
jgi:hypothetical protein